MIWYIIISYMCTSHYNPGLLDYKYHEGSDHVCLVSSFIPKAYHMSGLRYVLNTYWQKEGTNLQSMKMKDKYFKVKHLMVSVINSTEALQQRQHFRLSILSLRIYINNIL